jgi:V/A-type H+-transporting ATPase subunit C
VLSDELKNTYMLIKNLQPKDRFSDLFLVKNDFHNLKVLVKSEFSGKDGSSYLSENGTIPLENLKEAVLNRDFSDLPPAMTEALKKAYETYGKTQNGQLIDVELDKGAFILMKEYADECKSEFAENYVSHLANLTNLKSFFRIKKMGGSMELFEEIFVEGGNLDSYKFKDGFASDNPAGVFKYTDYGKVCETGMAGGFTLFEKLCDDYLTDFATKAKMDSLSEAPLIAYIHAKETEIKCVRIIVSGKINNIPAEKIKERVRMAYV